MNISSKPTAPAKKARPYIPKEFKLVPIRECPTPEHMALCDTPERAAAYWNQHIPQNPYFDPERECFVILILNTRRRIRGHQFLSMGTMDSLLVHPRDVFKIAIVAGAASILAMHSHPSQDPTPSEADIRVTRDLMRAGQLLKIELLDHVIVANKDSHVSLRALGYLT